VFLLGRVSQILTIPRLYVVKISLG
jgi:hypothetical protein